MDEKSRLQKELSGLILTQKLSVKESEGDSETCEERSKRERCDMNTVSEEKFPWNVQPSQKKPDMDSLLVEKSETILRIAMMRLDEVIEL